MNTLNQRRFVNELVSVKTTLAQPPHKRLETAVKTCPVIRG
jgi:hypothetical protein